MKYFFQYNGGTLGGTQNRGPTGVAYCNGFFYLAYINAAGPNTLYVYKIDPITGLYVTGYSKALPVQYFNVVGFPSCGAFGNYVWINGSYDSNNTNTYMFRLNTLTGVIDGPVALGVGLAVGEGLTTTPDGDAWISAGGVKRIDWTLMTIKATIAGTGTGTGFAYDSVNGFVWASSSATNTIYKIDPGTNAVVDTIVTGGAGYKGLVYGFGSLWAAAQGASQIHRINTVTKAITTIASSASPYGIGVDKKAVGYCCGTNPEKLEVINPKNNTVIASIPIYTAGNGGVCQTDGNKDKQGFLTGNQNRHTVMPWGLILGTDRLVNMHMGFKKASRRRV